MTGPWSASWDVVDEGSAESFPASDPPAWMGSAALAAPSAASVAQTSQPAPRLRGVRIVVALTAIVGALLWLRRRRS